jgi:hypothetical protein
MAAMWSQPPYGAGIPERQVFQTFADRRRSQTKRRVASLVLLLLLIAGVWIARPHFPGTEAKVRAWFSKVFQTLK